LLIVHSGLAPIPAKMMPETMTLKARTRERRQKTSTYYLSEHHIFKTEKNTVRRYWKAIEKSTLDIMEIKDALKICALKLQAF